MAERRAASECGAWRRRAALVLLVALVLAVALVPAVAPAARAQELPGIGGPDTVRTASASTWRRAAIVADLRVRGDFVRRLPGGRDDLRRARAFLRLGAAAFPAPPLELGAVVEAALGSDHVADNHVNNDVEPSDGFGLDQAYARWMLGRTVTLAAGRTPLPLRPSALVWDEDLRPAGASIAAHRPWRDYDTFSVDAGWFALRSLDDSWVRLAAAQLAYAFRDGAPAGADVRLAYLWYDRFASLVADGLARTNAVAGGAFVSEFDLLDVQVAARVGQGDRRCIVHGEWVENLGAGTESSGWRAGLTVGDVSTRGHVELRYFSHRVERDAVLAAFNSDDWWFHSGMRGHRAGIAFGLGRGVVLGVSGSLERRDLGTWTRRLLLDLRVDLSS